MSNYGFHVPDEPAMPDGSRKSIYSKCDHCGLIIEQGLYNPKTDKVECFPCGAKRWQEGLDDQEEERNGNIQ